MKPAACASGLIWILASSAGAQESRAEFSPPPAARLESFRLSGAPALGLLGASSSSVLRPNTPRELIANIVSSAGSDRIVPDGFAMETAPFWLARHRRLSLGEYHRASLGDRLRYFTAVSVATTRERARADSLRADASAAIAVRTLLVNGRPSSALVAIGDSIRAQQIAYIEQYRRWETAQSVATGLETLQRQLDRQEQALASLVTRVILGGDGVLRDSASRVLQRRDSLRARVARAEEGARLAARFEADLDRTDARLATLARRFAGEEIEPEGFILEFAGGGRATFEEGEWTGSRRDGLGIWLTPMYRFAQSNFEMIGVLRYLTNVADYDGRDLLDAGARFGVEAGRGSLSAEHVWRSVDGGRSTTRWTVSFDYPLDERIWAVASFGSDYRRPAGRRPAIATIGINIGFGAIEILPSPDQ